MATAGAFGVVGVDCAVFYGGDCLFDEAGFVESVGVDEALDVVFVADTGRWISGWSVRVQIRLTSGMRR